MSSLLLSGTTNPTLAHTIARLLRMPFQLAESNVFSDGELYVRVPSVRGRRVVVVQSGAPEGNRAFVELLLLLDAVFRGKPRSVDCVLPFYPYRRQERQKETGEAIGSAVVARMLQSFPLRRIVTVALHSTRTKKFFQQPLHELDTLQLFVDYFAYRVDPQSWVVVAPDEGGTRSASALAMALHLPLVRMKKQRRKHDRVSSLRVVQGSVAGKHVLILDDEINTGETMIKNSTLLKRRGARDIFLCATHPVFSGVAVARLRRAPVRAVVVTDTIALPREKRFATVTILSVAPLIAQVLKK